MSGALALFTKSALLTGLVGIVLFGLFFARRQNEKRGLGGRISKPKLVWLLYAVYFWFVVCPLLALDPALTRPLRVILGAFAASMWLRGLAEMFMLYVTKSWRPPYGVGHDVFSMVLIVLGLLLFRAHWEVLRDPLQIWIFALVLVLLASLALETFYAAAFFRAVEGRTTGEDGLWFADDADPRFRRINLITAAANVPFCAFLLIVLFVLIRM